MPRRSQRAEALARADNIVRVSTRGGPHPGADRRVMARRARKMLAALELADVELSLALVDDDAMQGLNRQFRRVNRPTDVLAFAMREGEPMATGPPGPELLGDVVISVDTARRQAAARQRPLLDELTLLLAHGLLHLLGHDHQSDRKERAMAARTRELEQAASARDLG